MPLKPGDKAPAFNLAIKPGETVNSADLFGQEKIVLLFIPFAYSPPCTAELCTMREGWSKWEGIGARVFAISVDSPFVTVKFAADEKVPFPILSDFNKEAIQAYDCMHDELVGCKGVAKRSAFVIDSNGKIAYASVSGDAGQQPDFEAVAAAVSNAD